MESFVKEVIVNHIMVKKDLCQQSNMDLSAHGLQQPNCSGALTLVHSSIQPGSNCPGIYFYIFRNYIVLITSGKKFTEIGRCKTQILGSRCVDSTKGSRTYIRK